MDPNDVMDSVAHEFLLVKVRRELNEVNDIETLRNCCVDLVDLHEKQKAMFKQMLYNLIDEEVEPIELHQ